MKKALLIVFGFCSISIYAQCTQCNTLEDAMKAPQEVSYLTLKSSSQDEGVKQIPAEIGELTNLKSLTLVNQDINSLPSQIGSLSDLQMVVITGCDLTELPESFFNLKKLAKVNLSNNKFSEVYKEKLRKRFATEYPRARLRL